MRYIALFIVMAVLCLGAYYQGRSEGTRIGLLTSQTNCVVALRMAITDICTNPKSRCEALTPASQ